MGRLEQRPDQRECLVVLTPRRHLPRCSQRSAFASSSNPTSTRSSGCFSPFAAKGLRAQCIIMRDIEESGLSITAYFVGIDVTWATTKESGRYPRGQRPRTVGGDSVNREGGSRTANAPSSKETRQTNISPMGDADLSPVWRTATRSGRRCRKMPRRRSETVHLVKMREASCPPSRAAIITSLLRETLARLHRRFHRMWLPF